MRLLAALVAACCSHPAAAQEKPPPDKAVEKAKASTVVVRAKHATGKPVDTTGMVFRIDDKHVWILAARGMGFDGWHKVDKEGKGPTFTVTYRAGTADEVTVPAELRPTSLDHPVGLLKVEAVKGQPPALEWADVVPVYGDKLWHVGCAGQAGDGVPPLEVVRRTVTCVGKDEFGRLGFLGAEGPVGTSAGGPVLDSAGRVVGVGVGHLSAKTPLPLVSVLPAAVLRTLLTGTVGLQQIIANKSGDLTLSFVAGLVDPFEQLSEPRVLLSPRDGTADPTPDPATGWKILPGGRPVELKPLDRAGPLASPGQVVGNLAVKPSAPGRFADTYFAQVVYRDAKGREVAGRPVPVTVFHGPTLGAFAVPSVTLPPTDERPAAAATERHVNGAAVRTVRLASPTATTPPVWDRDGKAFAVLTPDGTLLRYSFPELKLLGRLVVGGRCGPLTASAEGLVATAIDRQEAWVVDPATLKPVRKILTPAARSVVSAPPLSVAYATYGGVLAVLDLKTGKTVKTYPAGDLPGTSRQFEAAELTPDGKTLFTGAGSTLRAWEVDGERVAQTVGRKGWVIGLDRGRILLNEVTEGSLVSRPPVGKLPRPGNPPAYHSSDDLSKPVLFAGAAVPTLAFAHHVPTGRLAWFERTGTLVVRDIAAEKSAEYDLLPGDRFPKDALPTFVGFHSGGRWLVAITQTQAAGVLVAVELPKVK